MTDFTTTDAEWRLTEPGLWRLDGTEMFIRLSIGCPLLYHVGRGNTGLTCKFSLHEAKVKAAELAALIIEAGMEP